MDDIKNEDMRKKYAKIVAKAWVDEDYKKNLLNNTETVLKDEGIEIPAGLKIKIIEEPENTKIFTLPQKPCNFDKIEELENRIAANDCYACGSACTCLCCCEVS